MVHRPYAKRENRKLVCAADQIPRKSALDIRSSLKHKGLSRRCGECDGFAATLENVAI
jgi:hypothetical protein